MAAVKDKVKYDFTMFAPSFNEPYMMFKVNFKYIGYKKIGSAIRCYFKTQKHYYVKQMKYNPKEHKFSYLYLPLFETATFELRDNNNEILEVYDNGNFINIDFKVDKNLRFENFILNNDNNKIYFTIDFNCDKLDLDNELLFFKYFINHTDTVEWLLGYKPYFTDFDSIEKWCIFFKSTYSDCKDVIDSKEDIIETDEYKQIVSNIKKICGDFELEKQDELKEKWPSLYEYKDELKRNLLLYKWLIDCYKYPECIVASGIYINEHSEKMLYKENYYYYPNEKKVLDLKDFIPFESYEDYHNYIISVMNKDIPKMLLDPTFGFKYALYNRLLNNVIFRNETKDLKYNYESLLKGKIPFQKTYQDGDIEGLCDFSFILWLYGNGISTRESTDIIDNKKMFYDYCKDSSYAIPISDIVNKHFDELPFVKGYKEITF